MVLARWSREEGGAVLTSIHPILTGGLLAHPPAIEHAEHR
jgi:hypothetical protein